MYRASPETLSRCAATSHQAPLTVLELLQRPQKSCSAALAGKRFISVGSSVTACRPGVCVRLYSRLQWNALAQHQLPEMQRSPLEPLCLSIKSILGDRPVTEVLKHALTPPAPAAVSTAMQLLHRRQLLDESERLTALGQHLASMPLDPAVGALFARFQLALCR